MPPSRRQIPEINCVMVSFDMLPGNDEGFMRMARYDLGRMKNVTKQKNAVTRSNAYRVSHSETRHVIEFLDTAPGEEASVNFRMIYSLHPGFRSGL